MTRAAVLALAMAALALAGCSRQEEYPSSVKDQYLSSCLASAKEANARREESARLDDAAIGRFCACTWEGVSKNISLKEFMAYENAVSHGGVPDQSTVRKISELAVPCQMDLQKDR